MSSYYDKADYILAIAEEQNISRAAEKLYVSQSTLTMHLNRIEKEFGTELFDRSVRPVIPTKAGILYINNLRAVRRMEQEFMSDLRHILNPKETFNMGIGPIRSKIYMPSLVRRLRESYPQISINIAEFCDAELPVGLYQGTLDVIFGCFNPTDLLFAQTVPLGREPIGIIAPEAFKLHQQARGFGTPGMPHPISIRQLNHLPTVVPGQENDLYAYIMNILSQYGISPASMILTKSTFTAVGMVSKGLGYAFVEYPFLKGMRKEELSHIVYLSLKEQKLEDKNIIAAYSKSSVKQEMIVKAISLFQEIF